MDDDLAREAVRLAGSWDRYEAAMLRDYLVREVEDPRVNVQSILTRHFLIEALFGNRFAALELEELRFAAAMNWLIELNRRRLDREDFEVIHYALTQGSDNAEGLEIPEFIVQLYHNLPPAVEGLEIANYLAIGLGEGWGSENHGDLASGLKGMFLRLWKDALSEVDADPVRTLELGCGSANDFRFFHVCGLDRFLDYQGIDLSEKNIANARAMFPGIAFDRGNAFDLKFAEESFDCVFAHDLFEHLSIAAMERAVGEMCRVTRAALAVGFFNMDEGPEHVVQPVDEYHWNRLSMAETRRLVERAGFDVQVIHIGSLLEWTLGCRRTHNPRAYTFFGRRRDQVTS